MYVPTALCVLGHPESFIHLFHFSQTLHLQSASLCLPQGEVIRLLQAVHLPSCRLPLFTFFLLLSFYPELALSNNPPQFAALPLLPEYRPVAAALSQTASSRQTEKLSKHARRSLSAVWLAFLVCSKAAQSGLGSRCRTAVSQRHPDGVLE